MTASFTNKHTNGNLKRYFYYRCISTLIKDWNNCPVKQVNADKLEQFVVENLERIDKDYSYVENMVFRLNYDIKTGNRKGFELSDSEFMFSAEGIKNTIRNVLTIAKEGKRTERNFLIRKFLRGIEYSPEEIALHLNYFSSSAEKQENLPVLESGRTGRIQKPSSQSWGATASAGQAGDRRIVEGNCEPADKASSPSCEGRGRRAFNNGVRNCQNGGAPATLIKTPIYRTPSSSSLF